MGHTRVSMGNDSRFPSKRQSVSIPGYYRYQCQCIGALRITVTERTRILPHRPSAPFVLTSAAMQRTLRSQGASARRVERFRVAQGWNDRARVVDAEEGSPPQCLSEEDDAEGPPPLRVTLSQAMDDASASGASSGNADADAHFRAVENTPPAPHVSSRARCAAVVGFIS